MLTRVSTENMNALDVIRPDLIHSTIYQNPSRNTKTLIMSQ